MAFLLITSAQLQDLPLLPTDQTAASPGATARQQLPSPAGNVELGRISLRLVEFAANRDQVGLVDLVVCDKVESGSHVVAQGNKGSWRQILTL